MEKSKEGKIQDNNKLNYEIDWDFIELLAKRMQKGKEKYEPYSWKNITNIESLKQAYFRHSLEVMKGNYFDDSQEFGHIGGCAANLMMIYYQLKDREVEKSLKEFNITELVREYPNDMELGRKLRELVI